ncbi:MFS general substrate transporter [Purpureocillium lavendulum]|uniref:MFS general substrate transporter n=1 Tax=Purpureocillium lavendulum TaxID=1247861 RepID=A0AB34FTK4_9HYPO|nr:MFS general substrate transporter [Purpureocillium lavendulum]
MKSIAIFPASGALGTSTYTHLLASPSSSSTTSSVVDPTRVTLISRFPAKVPPPLLRAGVRTAAASYESPPERLRALFAGHDVLFLVSYPSHEHALRTRLQLPVIDDARAAGVRHVFYSSLAFAADGSGGDAVGGAAERGDGPAQVGTTTRAEVMRAHLDTEAHLARLAREDPGFTYTVIREGLYSESYPIYTAFFDVRRAAATSAAGQQQQHEILIPHDGSGPGISWVKRDELGEATARLIAQYATATAQGSEDVDSDDNNNTDNTGDAPKTPASSSPFLYVNAIVTLTGPRAYSLAETAAVLSRAVDYEGSRADDSVRIREVSVDEYVVQRRVQAAFAGGNDDDDDDDLDLHRGEALARTWATAWDAIRAGETALVDGTLRDVLGREPEAFEATIRRLVDAQ